MIPIFYRPRSLLQRLARRKRHQHKLGLLAIVVAGTSLLPTFKVGSAFVRTSLFSNTLQGTGIGQHWTEDRRRPRCPSRAEEAELMEPPVDAIAGKVNKDGTAKRQYSRKRANEPKPTNLISKLVRDKLGLQLNESDIAYTIYAPEDGNTRAGYFAKVTFKSFKGKPSHVGEMNNSKNGAIRSAVEAAFSSEVLQAASIKKTMSATPTKTMIQAAPTKKTIVATPTKKTILIADLEIGQELTGVVTGKNRGGVYLNISADTFGYLRARELQDEGIPTEVPPVGEKMSVRVLSKNQTYIWLTRRSGDLERPPMMDHLHLTATSFEGLPTTKWFDAEVVDMTLSGVILRAMPPEGGEPAAAYLDQLNFAADFGKKAKLGDKVRVRKKKVKHDAKNHRDFLIVSMREEVNLESINVGDTVSGTVARVDWLKQSSGVFVDLGTNMDGFLSDEESTDGFPFKRLGLGDYVTARVLVKDSTMLSLTRRSGDLARSTPPVVDSQADLSPFATVSRNEWFDGQVLHMRRPKGRSAFILVAVQLPGTTAYTTGFLSVQDATNPFLNEVSVGMTTKVRIKKVRIEPRRLLLTMKELESNSDGTQENNLVEEATSVSESAHDLSTEATIEETTSTSESSQTPLTEAASEEALPASESPRTPSAEGVPGEAAEAKAPDKKSNPFEDLKSVIFR